MNWPSLLGALGVGVGLLMAIAGIVTNLWHVSRHGEPSLLGLRLQVIGFAVVMLAFGVDILIAAGGLGTPTAAAAGALIVLLGVAVLMLATRLRVRSRPEDP